MDEETETPPDEGGIVPRMDADEAFGLLGNDTRVAILRALFEAKGPATFSHLREVVGMRDSGQFNYHLDKLVGGFVEEREGGYVLTAAGNRVVGGILAGRYTKSVESDRVAVGAECPHCAGSLVGDFEGDRVQVVCEECERLIIDLDVPPGTFEEYPREEWPAVAEAWTRAAFETVVRGFCRTCNGPTESTVETDSDIDHDLYDLAVRYDCRRCGFEMRANVGAHLVFASEVVAFYQDHGVDLRERPLWELDWAVQPRAEVVSTDPLRVECPIEAGGDRMVVTVDGGADVVGVRRE